MTRAEPMRGGATALVAPEAVPTIVADDVHLVYTVAGRYAKRGGPAALRRMLLREPPPGLREIHAIRGVSFTARRGETIGIVGANGSGKSTFLRAIAGLMPPRSGAIYTQGQPALLDVSGALMNDLPGERNIRLGCLAMGMSPRGVHEHYDWICEFAGLGEFLPLPMTAYSTGMAARLRFAIAAAKAHEVLLIDEALAVGDAQFRRRSEQRIRELRDAAGTVLLVSHSLGVIRETCTRVMWMEQGRIRADGDAETVLAAYQERTKSDR